MSPHISPHVAQPDYVKCELNYIMKFGNYYLTRVGLVPDYPEFFLLQGYPQIGPDPVRTSD